MFSEDKLKLIVESINKVKNKSNEDKELINKAKKMLEQYK